MVQQGLELGGDLNLALNKISDVVSEVYKYAQQIGGATNEQSAGSSQISKSTSRLTEITRKSIPRSRSRPPALTRLSGRWKDARSGPTSHVQFLATRGHGRTLGQAFSEADRGRGLFRSRGRRTAAVRQRCFATAIRGAGTCLLG